MLWRRAASRTAVLTAVALVVTGCAAAGRLQDRLVGRPATCADRTIQIYFEADSATVTREGSEVIRRAAQDARHCRVERIDVTGLADAAGAPQANLDLSRRRAQSVTAALIAQRLPAPEIAVAAVGQEGALTQEGQARPLRRRADITLHLTPPRQSQSR